MGIEAIGSVSRLGGLGAAVKVGPMIPSFVSEGSVGGFSTLASIGPKLEAPSFSLAPKALPKVNLLSGYRPMEAADVGKLSAGGVFKPEPKVAEVPAVFKRELVAVQTYKAKAIDKVVKQTALALMFAHRFLSVPSEAVLVPDVSQMVMPKIILEAAVKPASATKIEYAQVASSPARVEIPEVEEEIEEVIEDKEIMAQEKKEDNAGFQQSEQQSIEKVALVEAVEISAERRQLIIYISEKAEEIAKQLGLKGFTGKLARQFLSWIGKASPIVQGEDEDGTIPLTDHAILSDRTEYTSAKEAVKKWVPLIERYKPVKRGAGKPVTVEEVRQVIEGKEAENPRTNQIAEIVVKRLVKITKVVKGRQVVHDIKEKVESPEHNLKDLGLEEIFPKAA